MFSSYFVEEVLKKRAYLRKEWAVRVIENSIRTETQADGRVRHWGVVEEFGGKVFRVVTLADERIILNMFPDRRFKP